MLLPWFVVIDISRAVLQCGDRRLAYQREVAAVRFEHNQRHSAVPRVRNESSRSVSRAYCFESLLVQSTSRVENKRRECSAEMTDMCHVVLISARNSN